MDTLALILSIIGSLNWGLVGIFQFDLVAWLFGGQGSLFSRIVYTVVGLAGLWCETLHLLSAASGRNQPELAGYIQVVLRPLPSPHGCHFR